MTRSDFKTVVEAAKLQGIPGETEYLRIQPQSNQCSKTVFRWFLRGGLAWLVVSIGSAAEETPSPLREFRGVWVATVANIDWPSKKGLSTAQQKDELLAIFDKAIELNLNAVILQARPMCDAFYASQVEPWSEYLTGTLGKAPEPYYDPLEFAVEEAHHRGLELHVWFNPYRARHPTATSPIPDNHIVKRRPDLAPPYGRHYWLNPTHADVQTYSLSVILDVVRRYDIDGVHFDDYFYPYKERDAQGNIIPFPDDDTWSAYQQSGGTLSRDDWRRDAVNRFVERLYRDVKKAKPWVKVGISPFGIWRPGHPPGIVGLDQYAELYADAKLWLNKGWCDYFTPQLYWPIKQEKQSYPRLLEWWANENKQGRHLWPGNIPSRVTGSDSGWPAKEIFEQIEVTRRQDGAGGNVHFSMKPLLHNTGGVAETIKAAYPERALVPATPWLQNTRPEKPRLQWDATADQPKLRIDPAQGGIRLFVVRTQNGGKWYLRIVPAQAEKPVSISFDRPQDRVIVSAIDRAGTESEWSRITK